MVPYIYYIYLQFTSKHCWLKYSIVKRKQLFCCFYFIFVYLIFMSQIVLYCLHSSSVLSCYIDVFLTLSIASMLCFLIQMHCTLFFGSFLRYIHVFHRHCGKVNESNILQDSFILQPDVIYNLQIICKITIDMRFHKLHVTKPIYQNDEFDITKYQFLESANLVNKVA